MSENRYTSIRIIDEKPKKVIVDEIGNVINRDPSKDELKGLNKLARLKDLGSCCRCGINLSLDSHPRKEYKYGKLKSEGGIFTGKWICNKCYGKYYEKHSPNSKSNKLRHTWARRRGTLDPNCTSALGDMFEEVTSQWRGIEILSKKYDHFTLKYDHTKDSKLGIIQTKGRHFYRYENREGWHFSNTDRYKIYDYQICYCLDENGLTIERIYIIPSWEIINKIGFHLVKNPKDRWGNSIIPWYEEYRIKDEETLKLVNAIWKKIKGE